MADNKDLLKKADFALADLSGGGKGGLLEPEQSNTFIQKLIAEPTLVNSNLIRVVPMNSPQMNINKIGFGKRILRKMVTGTSLDTAAVQGAFDASAEATARAAPVTEQIQLNAKLIGAQINIPYDVMEDNIERATAANNEASNTGPGGLRDSILALIAKQSARDLEEMALLSDTGASDVYLNQTNGWLELAEDNGNVVDVASATISKGVFKAGLKAMPDQYKRDASLLTNFVSKNNELEYRDTLADRVGALGDGMTTGAMPARAYEMGVTGVSLMPSSVGLLTNPMNLIMGIHRQVSLEFDKDITKQSYIIVLTARVDFQIEETLASVYYKNIATA